MDLPALDVAYITPTDIRAAVTGLANAGTFPDTTLERFVSRYEQLAENYRGVAFTPRETTEAVYVRRSCGSINLKRPRVIVVTAITYAEPNAPALPSSDEVTMRNGALWSTSLTAPTFAAGYWLNVTYIHGYLAPPPAIVDGCIEFVRAEALQQAGSIPRNVTGIRDDLGWSYEATADIAKARPTKWMAVNDALNSVQDERIVGIG